VELRKRNPRTPPFLRQDRQGKESLAGEIKSTDRAIDELVASRQLYGLTEDEVKVVEGK
jgi:hypothetical protein